MSMRGHGALRAVAVARHLDEDGTHGGSEHRFIDHVHDLRALGLGIILQQDARGTAAIHGSNAVELLARVIGTNRDLLRSLGWGCQSQHTSKSYKYK